MGILDGKRILVTGRADGVAPSRSTSPASRSRRAPRSCSPSFGRTMRITQTIAKRLPTTPPVIELDASNAEDFDALADRVREHVDGLDGVLHSIGFAPEAALGGNFLNTEWADVATARADLGVLAEGPRRGRPAADADRRLGRRPDLRRVAWPGRSTTGWAWPRPRSSRPSRYLARDLGPEASGSTWSPPAR